MAKIIPLTRGKVAVVSDHQYERVMQYGWCAEKGHGTWYARGQVGGRMVLLHRFILGLTDPNIYVDHIDGDGLNCRDENMRLATRSENNRNRRVNKNNTSGFKGISKSGKRWMAQIFIDGKRKYLGQFGAPEAAARAYDEAAKKYYGEFANLNFPDDV